MEPGIRQALSDAQTEVDSVSDDVGPASWDNTLGRLDRALEKLSRRIAPLGHLVSVAETKELRDAYNSILPEISAFWSPIPLDPDLWKRLEVFENTDEANALRGIERRHLKKTLSEFRRAGANLPADQKDRLQALQVELAQTQQKFSENVLDATAAWALLVTDESRLDGVPEAAKRRFSARANENGDEGWTLTLDYPSVEPILKHCRDSELRHEVFVAYTTRCREGEHDNRPLLARILRMRDEIAHILGYEGFPDYVLADRMAGTGVRAVSFEQDLVERTQPTGSGTQQLSDHAKSIDLDTLKPGTWPL